MQRVFLAGLMMFLVCGLAGAQDFPKVEIFGGYSLLKAGGSDFNDLLDQATVDGPEGIETSKWFTKGFDASFTYNLNHYFGLEAAIQYNTNDIMKFKGVVEQFPGDPVGFNYDASLNASDFSFMVGPKFAYRKNEWITPFAHALIGVNHISLILPSKSMAKISPMSSPQKRESETCRIPVLVLLPAAAST